MRTLIRLDHSWFFATGDERAWIHADFLHGGWKEVTVPATNLALPWNGFDEGSYQFVSTWLRDFELAASGSDRGKRVFVDFEAVMASAKVFVNGELAGSHDGGYTPFSLEIGGLVRPGRNRLAVQVDSRETDSIPPFGHVVDYLSYGGIYREAFVRVQDEAYIGDLFAKP
ncbi:MAG: sugar-binding domain-containing protein, partial [Spirochaetota bacterium]